MLNKICFLLVIFTLCNKGSFSQKFMQGAGVTTSIVYGNTKPSNGAYKFWQPYSTFTYFPRYNIAEFANAAFSIGAPVGAGAGIITDAFSNKFAIIFTYDLGIALDLNIGAKSTYDNPKSFGYYLGGGFSYTHIGGSRDGYVDFNGATYGPLVRGGLRFLFSRGRWEGHALTTGLFYRRGIEDTKLSTIGLNLLWDF